MYAAPSRSPFAALVVGLGLISALLVPRAIWTMPLHLALGLAIATGVLVAVRRRWPIGVLIATAAVLLVGQMFPPRLSISAGSRCFVRSQIGG